MTKAARYSPLAHTASMRAEKPILGFASVNSRFTAPDVSQSFTMLVSLLVRLTMPLFT